jgi:hypothetical protein
LAKGVREGGIYKLLDNPMELVNSSERLDEPSSFEEAYAYHAWKYAMKTKTY